MTNPPKESLSQEELRHEDPNFSPEMPQAVIEEAQTLLEATSKAANQTQADQTQSESDSAAITMYDRVLNALKSIYDPEIPVDIYELGLIYEINLRRLVPQAEQYAVFVRMTLTSPNCPSAEQIPVEVKQKISAISGVQEVELELTFEPPYTTEMMSEAAKLQLGFM
jgi:FeS assembly SUF system protein